MRISSDKQYEYFIYLLVAIGSFSLFDPVMEPDGALYASIARHIAVSGDWLNLYSNGTDWLDKPHLTFWIAAASFKIFGITAFAYKLPSFLFTLTGAGYLYVFVKDLYDRKTALISVVLYLSALHVLISNSDVRAEGYLTAFLMASIYHYHRAIQRPLHVIAGSLFAAFAVMVKGIFVLAPLLGAFIVYWLWTRQFRELMKWKWAAALLLILLFSLPELYALWQQFDQHPEKIVFGQQGVSGLKFFFWDSQFGRFFNTGPIRGKGDPTFFIHTTLWAFLPWSILLITALVKTFQKRSRQSSPSGRFIALAFAAIAFLMFSLSSFQLPHYIIIIFPQLALILAGYLVELGTKVPGLLWKIQNGVLAVMIVLLMTIAIVSGFSGTYPIIGLMLLSACLAFLLFRNRSTTNLVLKGATVSLATMCFLYLFFYPGLLKYQSGMMAARYLNQHFPQAKPAVLFAEDAFSFNFYSNNEVRHLRSEAELKNWQNKGNEIIYANAQTARDLLSKHQGTVIDSFQYYRITRLSGKFLNAKTRKQVLDYYYLIRTDRRKNSGKRSD